MNIRNAIVGLIFSSLAAVGCESKDVVAAPDAVATVPEAPPVATLPVVCDCPPVVCDPAGQCCEPVPEAETAGPVAPETVATPTPVQPPATVTPVSK